MQCKVTHLYEARNDKVFTQIENVKTKSAMISYLQHRLMCKGSSCYIKHYLCVCGWPVYV